MGFNNLIFFATRIIKEVKIPASVVKICKNAFLQCNKLEKVLFSVDSKLQIIDEFAFTHSGIKKIEFPSSLTQICNRAFLWCTRLQIVAFPNDSKIENIEDSAFAFTPIKTITIPKNVSHLHKGTFDNCYNLRKFEIPKDSKLQIIDEAFGSSSIESIFIPFHVKEIKEYAFACSKIKIVEIDYGTELKCINVKAFHNCNPIIMIPKDSSLNLNL